MGYVAMKLHDFTQPIFVPTDAESLTQWLKEEMQNSNKCYFMGRRERKVFDFVFGYLLGIASIAWMYLFY